MSVVANISLTDLFDFLLYQGIKSLVTILDSKLFIFENAQCIAVKSTAVNLFLNIP